MMLAKEAPATESKRTPVVLLVDDDESLRQLVAEFLEKHGMEVLPAADGAAADAILAQRTVDVVVLDVMMPGEDGLSICRRLSDREARPAIIMLSAAGEDTDRIVGLELGADDYLPKPANPRELLARIRAMLRRSAPPADPVAASAPQVGYEFSGWTLSIWARELQTPDGVVVPLTGNEFALLRTFVEHPREVLDRDRILSLMRGKSTFAFDRAVDLQLSRLRRKLMAAHGEAGNLFRTVRNEGYIFVSAVKRI